MLYKFLRYLLQAIVIYLALRYTPYVRLDMLKAGIITVILTVFVAALEFVYLSYAVPPGSGANGGSCDVCALPSITPTPAPTCRIVCDDKKVENFAETKPETKLPTHQETAQKQIDNTIPQKLPNENYNKDTNTTKLGFGGMFYDDYVGSQNTGTYLSDPEYEQKRQTNERIAMENRRRNMEEQATTVAGYSTPYQDPGAKSELRKSNEHNRRIEGELDDDNPYGDYNQLIVGSGYKSHDWEFGYNFIPPEKWAPNSVRPPICVTDRRSSVYPVLANGTPVDVKEWHSAIRITPPDRINTDYINDKLNAGR